MNFGSFSARTLEQGVLYPILRSNPFPEISDLSCRLHCSTLTTPGLAQMIKMTYGIRQMTNHVWQREKTRAVAGLRWGGPPHLLISIILRRWGGDCCRRISLGQCGGSANGSLFPHLFPLVSGIGAQRPHPILCGQYRESTRGALVSNLFPDVSATCATRGAPCFQLFPYRAGGHSVWTVQ